MSVAPEEKAPEIDFSAFHPGAIEVKGIAGDHVGLGDYVHPAAHTKPVLHVHDREKVAKKIAQLVKDGISKLQIITDFDATLTKPAGLSSWSVLERAPRMSQSYRDRTYKLYKEYYPKEIDPFLTREQKIAYMVEWWSKAHECLMSENLTAKDFENMSRDAVDKVLLRDGCEQLFKDCARDDIPLLIFSAGIANTIDDTIQLKNLDLKKVHVISNRMLFDSEGKATGFESDPIHVFNKREDLIRGTPFHAEVVEKRNVILMGDSLGDVDMSLGLEHDTVLRFGFLNTGVGKTVQEHLSVYASAFDIVLIGDNTLTVPMMVIDAIRKGVVPDLEQLAFGN